VAFPSRTLNTFQGIIASYATNTELMEASDVQVAGAQYFQNCR
jgi:hypothetical protein